MLNRLNASTRSSTRRLAPSDTTLDSAASTVQNPGPLTLLRRKFPNVPGAGSSNAAGFSQSFRRPVAVRIGEHLVDPLIPDPGATRDQLPAITLIGAPERALTMPEILQSEAQERSARRDESRRLRR